MSLYYRMWLGGIALIRSRPRNAGIWKFVSNVIISLTMGFDTSFALLLINEHLGIKIPILFLNLDINVLNYAIPYFFSFYILNYFLIFYKDRYKKLEIAYKKRNSNLFVAWLIISYSSSFLYFTIRIFIIRYI